MSDPLSGNPLPVAPSGHMAGIYAHTDVTRGVWKAPANVVINGILSLEAKLTKGDQDILNPEPVNINALRDFTAQGRGLRVYGARCITSDQEWKYINVRRLFIFLEASLDLGNAMGGLRAQRPASVGPPDPKRIQLFDYGLARGRSDGRHGRPGLLCKVRSRHHVFGRKSRMGN